MGTNELTMGEISVASLLLTWLVIVHGENTTTNDDETYEDTKLPACSKLSATASLELAAGIEHTDHMTVNNSDNWTDEFETCQKITLTSNEVCAIDHSTIFVPAYDKVYSSKEYFVWKNEIYICLSHLHYEHKQRANESDYNISGYLTIVGLSISNVCLALHLLVFILIPEMQNLSGSNLAALATAVFCSNLFFIISQEMNERVACITLSSFTLFFFLSSFLWMSVIGFETWSSLRMASTKLRLSTKFMERKKYHYYSLYAWLTPLILVSVVLIVDASDAVDSKFKPGIGKEMKCWFTELVPLIIFFLLPLIIVMSSNLIFFLWSAFIIHNHTDRLNQDKKLKSLIRKFSSYGKLAIITGLTWITGIIAFAAKHIAMWYIFVIFTTFYGSFIFVAFTCTKKVLRHLRKRFSFIDRWVPSHSTETSTSKSATSESRV